MNEISLLCLSYKYTRKERYILWEICVYTSWRANTAPRTHDRRVSCHKRTDTLTWLMCSPRVDFWGDRENLESYCKRRSKAGANEHMRHTWNSTRYESYQMLFMAWMHRFEYIHIYIYIYIYIHIYIHTHTPICSIDVCVYMHVCFGYTHAKCRMCSQTYILTHIHIHPTHLSITFFLEGTFW